MSILRPPSIWRQRQQPNALEFSILAKLSPELLVLVAEFLPPVSAVAFSLCCRPLYSLIAAKNLRKARQNPRFRTYDLLALLERDLPDLLACFTCKKFHAIKHANQFVSSNNYYDGWIHRPKPLCFQVENRRAWYIYPGFSVTVFRMAMKRYRQGAEHLSLLNLLSSEWRITHYAGHIGKMTVSSKIVRGSLLIRVQSVFPVQHGKSAMFLLAHGHLICPHYDWRELVPHGLTSELEKCCHQENFEAWGVLMQCNYCATEFQMDVQDFGKLGRLVFFTKWQYLGTGRRPLDNQWLTHLSTRGGPMWKRSSFRPRSIRSAFEGRQEFVFRSLMTPEHKNALFSLPLESPWTFLKGQASRRTCTLSNELYISHLSHDISEDSQRTKVVLSEMREGGFCLKDSPSWF